MSWRALGLGLLMMGCGPRPAPEVVRPAGPVAVVAEISPRWHRYTDVERITAIFPGPRHVWARTANGLLGWDQTTATLRREVGKKAPGGDVTAVVEHANMVYAGSPKGLHTRNEKGRWALVNRGPLAEGVVALAPRRGGGVWVATPRHLCWVEKGRVHIVTDRYRIHEFATVGGVAWFSTAAHGVVQLSGGRLTEYTIAQGLCGQSIFQLRAGGGRLVALCEGSERRFSVWAGQRWYSYKTAGVGALQGIAPLAAGGLLARTDRGVWRLKTASAPLNGAPTPAVGARVLPAQGLGSVPPLPTAPVKVPPTPPPGVPGASPKPLIEWPPVVPMPMPIVAPLVSQAPLPIHRADRAPVGQAVSRPLRIATFDERLEPGVPTTSTRIADGVRWYAPAWRGLLRVRGTERRIFTALSLAAPESAQLAVGPDRAALALGGSGVNTWRLGAWRRWPVAVDPSAEVSAVGFEPDGGAWALAYLPPEAVVAPTLTPAAESKPAAAPRPGRLRTYHAAPGGAFSVRATLPLPDLDGPAVFGGLAVRHGEVFAPLFWRDKAGKRHGAGLVHVTAGQVLEHWKGALGLDPNEGGHVLPDPWVNAVALGPKGAVYVATNAGLVRFVDGRSKVFDENDFIPSEVVLDVAVEPTGKVWMATLEGLGALVADRWVAVDHPVLSGRIDALTVDPKGQVWVIAGERLWRRTGTAWVMVPLGQGPQARARALRFDDRGGLWLLTPEGVHHLPAR